MHQQPFKFGVPSTLKAKNSLDKDAVRKFISDSPLQGLMVFYNKQYISQVCWINTLIWALFLFSYYDQVKAGIKCLQLYIFFFFSLRLPLKAPLEPYQPFTVYGEGSKIIIQNSVFPQTPFQAVFLFEFQCVYTQSFLTLSNPMDCGPPGSSVYGIIPSRILEWVAISFSTGYRM